MSKEKITSVYVDENGNIYELKKSVWKRPLFWSTMVLSIFFILLFSLLIRAAVIYNELDNMYSQLQSKQSTSDRISKKVNSYMRAVAPTAMSEAADFAMSSNDHEYKFGESVKYPDGNLTVNNPQKDATGMIALNHGYENYELMTVGVVFENTSSSAITINPKLYFASNSFDEYFEYDAVFLGENTTKNSDDIITVPSGKKGVFAIFYAIPKEQAKDENYQVQFYNSIWKNK